MGAPGSGKPIDLSPIQNPKPGSLWEAFGVYAELHLATKSRHNWVDTVRMVHDFAAFLRRVPMPADLNDATVARFEKWLALDHRSGRPRSVRTVEARIERLYALWKFAANAGYVDHLPNVKRKNRYYRDEDLLYQ